MHCHNVNRWLEFQGDEVVKEAVEIAQVAYLKPTLTPIGGVGAVKDWVTREKNVTPYG